MDNVFAIFCRMASQPAMTSSKPNTVQMKAGQPIVQKGGCCS